MECNAVFESIFGPEEDVVIEIDSENGFEHVDNGNVLDLDLNISATKNSVIEEDGGLNEEPIITEPTVGMCYSSGEEFLKFMYDFAHSKEFQVIVRSSQLRQFFKDAGYSYKKGSVKIPTYEMASRLRIICSQGRPARHKGTNNTGCKCSVEGRFGEKENAFKIHNVVLEHNHPLDPKNSRHMPSYRKITDYFKQRMKLNDAARISIAQNFKSVVIECGGAENVPFTDKDARNFVNLQRREARLGGDALALEEYFKKKKIENQDFYYAIERDAKGTLMNVFWSDARCRAMFKSFLEVATYDTTFATNSFEMPFSPFVGVNHHGKSFMLASALLSNEHSDTFNWVFRRWLDCMGKPPTVMITDQCRAIGKAIRDVFGEAYPHRLCIWHILENARKNIGGRHSLWPEIRRDLNNVVHDSLDADEFEEVWHALVGKYNLQDNNWIKDSFAIKEKWVPAYWKGTFCAGMSSTQRGEQQNRFFKLHLSVQCGLRQFITQFDGCIATKVEEERVMNYECMEKLPTKVGVGNVFVEEVFHKLYTNAIFRLLQEEVSGLIHTNAFLDKTIGNSSVYKVGEKVTEPVWKTGRKVYEVSVNACNGEFTCTCKLFEFKGILYRHIISCIELEDIKFIADKHILDRWRKDLVRGYETIKVGYYDPVASSRVQRSLELAKHSNYISRLGLLDDEAFEKCQNGYKAFARQMEEFVGIDRIKTMGAGDESGKVWGKRRLQSKECNQRHMIRRAPPEDEGHLRDPVTKRQTGRPKKTRQPNYKMKYDKAGPSKTSSQPARSKRARPPNLDLSLS